MSAVIFCNLGTLPLSRSTAKIPAWLSEILAAVTFIDQGRPSVSTSIVLLRRGCPIHLRFFHHQSQFLHL